MPASEIIDAKQCAALLRCTVGEVEHLARLGEVPALRIGSAWLFVRSDLLLFLAQKARSEAQQRRLSPPAKSPAPSPAKVPETISPTPPKINEPGLKLVSASEAASLLSMGKSTFWRRVSENKFPQPVKIGRLTRWRVADLMHSIEVLSRKDT